MYCIVNVVYGTHITKEAYKILSKMNKELEDFSFKTLYSGGADIIPAYLGVKLSEFDEATDIGLKLSSINMKPTQEEKKQAEELYNVLPEKLKAVLPPLDVYLVFSTS